MIRAVRATLVLSLLIIAAGGCDGRGRGREAVQAPGPVRLTANLNPTLAYAPLMIAKEKGFFAQEGLDVEFAAIDQNSAFTGLISGKIDVYSGAVRSGIFNAIIRGANIRLVADRGHAEVGGCAPGAFAASPDIVNRIAAAGGSLRNETFVLFRGGITEYMIDRLIGSRGLGRDDVRFTQLPQGDYATSASLDFDAIRYVQEPTLSGGIAEGRLAVLARDEEFAPGNQHGAVLFGRRLLADRPLGVRVMRAYLRGVREYRLGKTDSNVAIVAKYTKLPPEVIRRACWVPLRENGMLNLQSVEEQIAWARGHGYLDGEIRRSQWWDPGYASDAARDL